MLGVIYKYAFWTLFPVVCGYAAWTGGRAERAAAVTFAAGAGASVALRTFGFRHGSLDGPMAFVDTAVLASYGYIALREDRWWPLFLTAFQSVATLSHLAYLLNVELRALGYQLMAQSSSYPTEAILVVATWRHRRRQAASNI